jgi:hypothetical protein
MSNIIEQFKQDLAEVPWKDLRIHLQRDSIVLVADGLSLLDVAVAVAEDDKPLVESWVSAGTLTKPTAEQIKAWEKQLDKPFKMLIVQPFILLQAPLHV